MRVRTSLVVAVLAVAATACTQVLDEASLEESLTQQVEENLDEDGITVDCPGDVEVERGGVFTCTATGADGAVATIEVTQTDDDGSVEWRFVDAAADEGEA
jgi:Domain of unknown function (DUF4333)